MIKNDPSSCNADGNVESAKQNTNRAFQSSRQPTGITTKASLFIAILALIVPMILFYALSRNMQGISDKINHLSEIEHQMKNVSDQLVQLSDKTIKIEAQTKKQSDTTSLLHSIVRNTLLDQAAWQLEYVSSHLEQQTGRDELHLAISLIKKAKIKAHAQTEITEPGPIQ